MNHLARLILLLLAIAAVGTITAVGVSAFRATVEEISAAPSIDTIVNDVLAARTASIVASNDDGAYGLGVAASSDVINVLVLGIDSRKEGTYAHCDAIHMVSVNVRTFATTITSVPRGTTSSLPPRAAGEPPYIPSDYYLANACGFGGLDYGVAEIEKVMGINHDYIVTVGFSQAIGVFRALGLPTTDTLQWLRHRQSYAIGDPQRSHNQAVFMEDMLRRYGNADHGVPATLLYVLYRFVDTDMDFGTLHTLYDAYVRSGAATDTASVTHVMKPYYATVDYHLDLTNPDEQITALLDSIRGRVSSDDLSDRPLSDVQTELLVYLNDALQQPEEAQHVVDEEMWRQVEDDTARESLQYAFTAWYATALVASDRDAAVNYVSDYILEKQSLGPAEYETRGRQLLASIVQ